MNKKTNVKQKAIKPEPKAKIKPIEKIKEDPKPKIKPVKTIKPIEKENKIKAPGAHDPENRNDGSMRHG